MCPWRKDEAIPICDARHPISLKRGCKIENTFRRECLKGRNLRSVGVIFSGVYSWLVKVLGQFSIIYFRGLGLRIGVSVWVWVWVRVRVRVSVRVRVGLGL